MPPQARIGIIPRMACGATSTRRRGERGWMLWWRLYGSGWEGRVRRRTKDSSSEEISKKGLSVDDAEAFPSRLSSPRKVDRQTKRPLGYRELVTDGWLGARLAGALEVMKGRLERPKISTGPMKNNPKEQVELSGLRIGNS